jgi:pimeloyl-ACP methyl ester carboxylesterase
MLVFISYHRSDLAVAEQVRTFLATHAVSTWMDQYDIPAGAYWPDAIDQGLQRADIVLGVLSPDAVASRNVKNEWDWALQNDRQLFLLLSRPCAIPHRYISINFIDGTGPDLTEALTQLLPAANMSVAPVSPASPMPETRYAQSGQLGIAYQIFGEGPLDLVLVPGFISHVEYTWVYPPFASHLRRWGTLARVIMFDKRGTGMSDRSAGIATMEERIDDVRAVMDAAGSERAVILGISEGVPLSILFAATYPERVHGLIAYGGSAAYVQQPDYPWGTPREEYEVEIARDEQTLFSRWGTLADARETVEHFVPTRTGDEELIAWLATLMRLGASPGAAIALSRMNMNVDVRALLPSIRVPTLVVNREGDQDARVEEARYMAERIPGAQLAVLPGSDHFSFCGDQDAFFAPVAQFLAGLEDERVTITLSASTARALTELLTSWAGAGAPENLSLNNETDRGALTALMQMLTARFEDNGTG